MVSIYRRSSCLSKTISMEISYYYYYYCVLSFLFLYLLSKNVMQKFRKLPPSPLFSLPIIGHLYLFKKPIHRTLAKISDRNGSVLFLQFGSRPVLLISSPSAAEECFTKNDIVFANRPRLLAGKHMGYNYTTLIWASYGHHWRNLRRIASLEILSTQRIQMFAGVRNHEIQSLVRRIFRGCGGGEYQTVEMKSVFFELMMNMMMRMIGGKRYYDAENVADLEETRKFKEMVSETLRLSGAVNVWDFVSVLKWVGVGGTEKRMEAVQEKRDGFMQHLIEENRSERRIRGKEEEDDDDDGGDSVPKQGRSRRRNKTMIDVLLSLQESEPEYYTDEIIRGLMIVMLSAGTDTSSGTLEWTLSLLLNNPEALKMAQDEIDTQIGESRLIVDSDLSKLPYLHGIINETLRMYPATPLIPAHESSEICTVGGLHVPRGTMLLVNVWAIQNDPRVWEDPEQFKPDRFLNSEGEKDKRFIFMPFGYGRRGCPGEGLARRTVALALGSLIQCFEWERVGEEKVDMSEGAGATMPKAQPLVARCRPRRTMMKLVSQL